MAVICNKIKSGECVNHTCSHAMLHRQEEEVEYDDGLPFGNGSCVDPKCREWTDVKCVSITEAEIYALRLLYGIRVTK
jgi:hypothetical protein